MVSHTSTKVFFFDFTNKLFISKRESLGPGPLNFGLVFRFYVSARQTTSLGEQWAWFFNEALKITHSNVKVKENSRYSIGLLSSERAILKTGFNSQNTRKTSNHWVLPDDLNNKRNKYLLCLLNNRATKQFDLNSSKED
jgi:hypothetical protein